MVASVQLKQMSKVLAEKNDSMQLLMVMVRQQKKDGWLSQDLHWPTLIYLIPTPDSNQCTAVSLNNPPHAVHKASRSKGSCKISADVFSNV